MPLPKMTYDRVTALLDRLELEYEVDPNDGEIGLGFENMVVWVNVDDHVTRMSGVWRYATRVPEDAARLLEFVNNSNSSRSIPKIFVRGDGSEENPFGIGLENSVPAAEGLSDEQFEYYFDATMGTFIGVIEELEEQFPDMVTKSEEE